MRIAFVISHINSSMQWLWFAEELKKRNIEHLFIISTESRPSLMDDLLKIGIEVYYLPHHRFADFFKNFLTVCKIFRKRQIQLVHTEMPHGNLLGQTAAYFCGIKTRITTCENTSWAFDYNNRKQKFIDQYTFRLAKRVIALTQEAKEFLIDSFHVPQKKISIIHHSLKSDDYLFTDASRIDKLLKELAITPDIFVIGMVARFEYWKGHIYAIEAFRKLIAEYPNVRLYIFGSKGESYETVMNTIQMHNLQDYVMYKGFVADNIALFRLFDVHLHIPIKKESETFGINIIEGMISGCAQVLTLSGISCFTARHEKNCLVVDYASSESIYLALKRMINHPELRQQLGEQAKADALRDFQYKEKVDQHLELYQALIKQNSK